MTLLPFETVELKTNLPLSEIRKRITANMEKRAVIRPFGSNSGKIFEGWLGEYQFELQNISVSHNTFLPVIRGTITETPTGARVLIHLQISVMSAVVLILGLLGCIVYGGYVLLIHKSLGVDLLIPAALFGFLYVLSIVSFNSEAAISKEHLQKLLEGQWKANNASD
ncbi:MAG: hypothetical protein Q8J69_05955 [Sphingobacteriaceae bacterium]|nr:hypothetical protein [Sphingobacteriaceae bacterium]